MKILVAFLLLFCSRFVACFNVLSEEFWTGASLTEPIAGDSPLEKCDVTEPQLLDIKTIKLVPNPPRRAQDLVIEATGKLTTKVTEGAYISVEVRLGYIKIVSMTFDLCALLVEQKVGISCPLEPGTYKIAKSISIPQHVPPGKYKVGATAFTADDRELACLVGVVSFPSD